MLTLARLVLAVIALGLGAGTAAAEPPVWVVRSPTATIVLFGSVHLLPPGLDWEPKALRTALAKADEVWFEIPIDDAAALEAAQAATEQGMQPTGQTLSAELSPGDWIRLAKAAQACGLPLAGLDPLKPWYADVTLSVASYRLAGAGVGDGVEHALARQLPPTIQRRAFESPREQITDIADAPLPDQIASLRETMGELEQGPAGYQRLIQAWMSGDARAVRRVALTPMMDQAPGVYRRMVVERNRRWLPAITDRLNRPGEAVMVVGIGHLVGPDGLPTLLRAQGWRVDGP